MEIGSELTPAPDRYLGENTDPPDWRYTGLQLILNSPEHIPAAAVLLLTLNNFGLIVRPSADDRSCSCPKNFCPFSSKKISNPPVYKRISKKNSLNLSQFGSIFEHSRAQGEIFKKSFTKLTSLLKRFPNLLFVRHFSFSGLALKTVDSEESLSTCFQWISLKNSGFGRIFEHFMTL